MVVPTPTGLPAFAPSENSVRWEEDSKDPLACVKSGKASKNHSFDDNDHQKREDPI